MPKHESYTKLDENQEAWTVYLSPSRKQEQLNLRQSNPLNTRQVLKSISEEQDELKKNHTFKRFKEREETNILAAYRGNIQVAQKERGYFAQHLKPVMGTFSGVLGTGMLLWSTLTTRDDREENKPASLDWIWWLTTLSGIGFTLLGMVIVIVATRQKHKEKNERQIFEVIEAHLGYLEDVKEELEFKLHVNAKLTSFITRGSGVYSFTEFQINDNGKMRLDRLFIGALEENSDLSIYEDLNHALDKVGIYRKTLFQLIKQGVIENFEGNLPEDWENIITFGELLQVIELSESDNRQFLFESFASDIVMQLKESDKLKVVHLLSKLLHENFALQVKNDVLQNYVNSSDNKISSKIDKYFSKTPDNRLAPFQDMIVFLDDDSNVNYIQSLINKEARGAMKDAPEKMLIKVLDHLSDIICCRTEIVPTIRKGMAY